MNFNGGSTIIAYGTGSRISHCTTALWKDDELFIVQAQVIDNKYNKSGLRKITYDKWIQEITDIKKNWNVSWLPLDKKLSDKFDEKAAWDWFNQREGLAYGLQTVIMGWIDTPYDNYPPILDPEL